jgi:hypothetical protein
MQDRRHPRRPGRVMIDRASAADSVRVPLVQIRAVLLERRRFGGSRRDK